MTLHLNPVIAVGVIVSTAATDAVYVMFTANVTARRAARAATWSSLWYLLAAFASSATPAIQSMYCSPPAAHGSAPLPR